MGRSIRRRDSEQARIDPAAELLDDRPGERWRERLCDDWRSFDAGEREQAVADAGTLAAPADAPGGRAVEAAGEDLARNVPPANVSAERHDDAAPSRLLRRQGPVLFWPVLFWPVLFWNEEAGVAPARADLGSLPWRCSTPGPGTDASTRSATPIGTRASWTACRASSPGRRTTSTRMRRRSWAASTSAPRAGGAGPRAGPRAAARRARLRAAGRGARARHHAGGPRRGRPRGPGA